MGRRRKRDFDDDSDFDSSDEDKEEDDEDGDEGGGRGFGGWANADEADEARLFQDPYKRARNKGKRRKTRQEREEDRMLGVFADDSDDDRGTSRTGAGSGARGGLGTAGVSFVKSDSRVGAGPEVEEDDDDDDEKPQMARDEDDDDDDERPSFGGLGMFQRQGSGWNPSATSASGSADAPDSDKEENEALGMDDDNEEADSAAGYDKEETPQTGADSMDVDDQDDRPRLGLGRGLGFGNGNGSNSGFQRQGGIGAGPRGGRGGRKGLGSRAGIGSAATPPPERKTIGSSKLTTADAAGSSDQPATNKRSARKVDKSFAKFEKHTKGFATKMMEKMGWTPGAGLGKDGAGIVQPIDVQVRPKNQGLAYNNFKEQTKAVREIEKEVKERHGIKYDISESEEDEEGTGRRRKKKGGAASTGAASEKSEKVQAWKVGGAPGKRKVTYKSAQELLAEQMEAEGGDGGAVAPIARQSQGVGKIIDMTSAGGPREVEVGALKSVSAAMTDSLMDDSRSLPELRHNMRLIVDMCQHDLLTLQRSKRSEDAKLERLRKEQVEVKQALESAKLASARMGHVGSILADFESHAALMADERDPIVALSSYDELFGRVERDMADEFAEFRLDELCVAAAVPWCQKLYGHWQPLEDPDRGVAFFRRWRRLLMVDPGLGKPGTLKREPGAIRQMTPYESLLSLVWLPRLRQVISNQWDPHQPDDLIGLLEIWYGIGTDRPPLLPQWLFLNILDQLVTPKLERALANWNPKKDSAQVHTWIHPWLPLFGDVRMQPLLDTVRQKMTVVLQDWKPSEDTALKMLEPWKEVFPAADMEQLVARIILPKLLLALRHELVVNPAKQDIKPIKWVLQWKDLLGINVVAHAFQSEFMPKWLWTLWQWLSHPTCNPGEVTQWYSVWKSPSDGTSSSSGVFPVDVLRHPAVAAGFRQGLDLMNQAMELRDQGVDLSKIPAPVPPPSTSTSAPPPLPKFASSDRGRDGRRSASPMPASEPSSSRAARLVPPKSSAPASRYQASIHDVMEQFFASKDLTFLPVEGRVHEATGKPLWRISRPGSRGRANDSLLAYLDEGVIYAREGVDVWTPMSMEDVAHRVLAM